MSNLWNTLLLSIATASCVFAQRTSTVPSASRSTTTSGSSSGNGTAAYPTKTIFLPLNNIGNVAASIITAAPGSTVYGLACLYETTSSCSHNASVTITEGPSTVIYTMTYVNGAGSTTRGPATINCTISGTSAAVCQGQSSISGLGAVSSSSTLAGSQLSFVPVSITAGAPKLFEVATQTAGASSQGSGSSSSSGGGPIPTVASWALGGAVAFVALRAI